MNYQELYVVCQIEDFSLKVMVNNYENNEIQVLYKKCIDNEQFAENGVIINPSATGLALKTIIENINEVLKIKVKRVALALPSYNLKIYQSKAMLDFKDSNHIVTNYDCNQVIEMAKNIIIDGSEVICLTKPYNFKIDNLEKQEQLPIGLKGQILNVEALIYSLPQILYDSQLAVLDAASCELLVITIDQFALACNINTADIKNNNIILINWSLNSTKISVFSNSILYATTTIKIGFNQIVQSLMVQMRCGYDKAERYLLKIININNNYLGDIVVDKYCDPRTKTLIHLTKADLQETVRKKVQEIIECIEYFLKEIDHDKTQKQIVCTGITLGIAGFVNYIKNYSKLSTIKFMLSNTLGVDSFEWSILIGITHYQHLVNVYNKNFLSSIATPVILQNHNQNLVQDNNESNKQYKSPLHSNYQYNG